MSMNMVYYFAFIDDIGNDKQMYGAAIEVASVTYNGAGSNCSLVINNVTNIFIDEWRVRSEYKESSNLTGKHYFEDTNLLIHL